MDNMDEYIWQRRVHHGVRYQKSAVPFPESVGLGLEFNAALDRKDKLDLCLLTNGVMLELCDFAKTVTKSEKYFLFEMMEFNFDLGVDADSEQQRYDYATHAHGKIRLLKDQIKMKPQRLKETFPLPDINVQTAPGGAEQPGRYCPQRNKMADSSVLTGGGQSSQSERSGVELKLTPGAYPFCKDLGVTLVVGPGAAPPQKLDRDLMTSGVMLELLHFSRELCGTHTGLVHALLKINFGYEVDKALLRSQVTKLMDRKYACDCLTAEDRDAFRKEAFKGPAQNREPKPRKRKEPDADYQEVEMASKRRETARLRDAEDKDVSQDGELSYMCPLDCETEMLSDSEDGPEPTALEMQDVKEEEEEELVSAVQPQIIDRGRVRPKSLKEVSDLFSEDGTEDGPEDASVKTQKQKLWRRRAPRSKQILTSRRVNDLFARCRERGLDFNVASASRQSLDLQLLTNCVMWEVYKFASAMTKSLRSFLFEILNNNFNLVLHGEQHERNFIFYMITKERSLQTHPERHGDDFLSRPFQFPEVYNMVDVTGDFQTGQEVEAERQTAVDPPADLDPHPFCRKLDLNLWALEERPASQKLDVTALTIGAGLEVFAFVRQLCGSVRATVNDVLEHNFDVDLQSGETEASQVIQRWYATQKSLMKRLTAAPKVRRWLNMVVPLNAHAQLHPPPPDANGPEDALLPEDGETEMDAFNGDLETEETEETKETEETEETEETKETEETEETEETKETAVNSYQICEGIGLELDVISKRGARTKLAPGVLTRGVLLEMHRYVEQNCNRYVPALYEILDYNFDLSSQSHRKVEFAWAVAAQVIAIAGKTSRKGRYMDRAVELPVQVQVSQSSRVKEEPEDGFTEPDLDDLDDLNDNNDVVFVRELKPVDIEVEID